MAAGGTPDNVHLGPGRLYYAPIGTTEPTSASAALPSAWQAIGYTENGTEISFDITSEAIEVEEELDPIQYAQTARRTMLSVQMAEMTKKRLALALGGGAADTDDAAGFEPPDPSAIVGVMLIWDSNEDPDGDNTNRRWIFRECTPRGSIQTSRRKAPDKATIGVEFDCAKPDTSTAPFKVFPNASGRV